MPYFFYAAALPSSPVRPPIVRPDPPVLLGALANAHGEAIKALGIGFVALGAALTAAKPGAMKEIARGIVTAWDGLAHLDFGKFVSGIGLELTGAFHLLPNQVSGAITSAVASIAALLSTAISGLPGMIFGAIAGVFKGIGGPATAPEGSGRIGIAPGTGGGRYHPSSFNGADTGLRHDISDRARSNAVPPKAGMTIALTNVTNVDGRTVARAVTKHQVASMEFANAIGGHDSYGSHYPAGSTAIGA